MGWREVMAGPAAVKAEQEVTENRETEVGKPHTEAGTISAQRQGKANRLAVTALILACLGPLLVGGILATVFGMVALDEIEESNGAERGRGIAQWAIGLGFLNIAVWCAIVVALITILT